jgi:hypothetical protein
MLGVHKIPFLEFSPIGARPGTVLRLLVFRAFGAQPERLLVPPLVGVLCFYPITAAPG